MVLPAGLGQERWSAERAAPGAGCGNNQSLPSSSSMNPLRPIIEAGHLVWAGVGLTLLHLVQGASA